MEFIKTLFAPSSILQSLYIFIAAIFAGVALYFSIKFASSVEECFEPKSGKKLQKNIYYMLDRIYTVFIAIISVFPLLGMFGTIQGLINMGGIGSSEESSFYLALTSTAWGIIFSVIFKIVNAGYQPYIENQISKAKKMLGL